MTWESNVIGLCSTRRYDSQVRGLANGAAATSNWIANAVVSQLFLALADSLGSSGVFWLLAGIACIAGIWTYLFLPETKGGLTIF